MTRSEADAVLARLAVALPPDEAGAGRLLERISVEADAETLRAALMERGAVALLADAATPVLGEP